MDFVTVAGDPKAGRARLVALLHEMPSIAVAFSGGVDSSFLLAMAVHEQRASVIAVTGVSASLSSHASERAIRVAKTIGAEHLLLATAEGDHPQYVANGLDRCFFCKGELFQQMAQHPAMQGRIILDGFNHSDYLQHRPGHQAAQDAGVRSPLAEAGLTKPMIRELSEEMGLETAHIPASPCLASRVQIGVPVTSEGLSQIEVAEDAVRSLGFSDFRVRQLSEGARVEFASSEHRLLNDHRIRDAVVEAVERAGFEGVNIDSRPLVSGRLVLEEGSTRTR